MTRRLLAPALAVALTACAPVYDGTAILGPLDTSNPEIAVGERVFALHCQQCHPNASAGLGPGITNKPLPSWAIRLQVRHGLGQMPAFPEEEISDAELDAVVAYIHALREHTSRRGSSLP
jgi:mono/diheme cytochrome c family protein